MLGSIKALYCGQTLFNLLSPVVLFPFCSHIQKANCEIPLRYISFLNEFAVTTPSYIYI
jgi:hypothetical protein